MICDPSSVLFLLDYDMDTLYNKSMRKISLSGCGYYERVGAEKNFALLAETGFDAMDFSLFRGNERVILDLGGVGSLELQCRSIRAVAERYGVEIGQTHAPFGWREQNADADVILETYRLSAIATRELGADKMVVHPIKFNDCVAGHRQQECFDLNLRVFERLSPVLRECGVKAMLENMFLKVEQGGVPVLHPTIYSTGEELARAADALGEDYAVCLDSGHALITGEDIPAMVDTLGSRIEVLHLHDNDGERDDHLPPYLGMLPFDDLMLALKKVGYAGNLNFEVHFGWVPEALLASQMRYVRDVAGRLVRILDGE